VAPPRDRVRSSRVSVIERLSAKEAEIKAELHQSPFEEGGGKIVLEPKTKCGHV